MPKIEDYISFKLRPYKNYILIVCIALVFIIVSIYLYSTFYSSLFNNSIGFNDVANSGENHAIVEVLFFHVDWCPHCVKATPEWESFCREYNGKIINGYSIQCNITGYNCTNDTDLNIKSLMDEYKIQSFPTVILFKENKKYDFDAKITRNSLEQFVQSSTI